MARQLRKIALNITTQEFDALEEYADKDGRTKTEVLRELIRGLPTYQSGDSEDTTSSSGKR